MVVSAIVVYLKWMMKLFWLFVMLLEAGTSGGEEEELVGDHWLIEVQLLLNVS